MPSTNRDRSVGKRLSSFFTPGTTPQATAGQAPSSYAPFEKTLPERPVSRGRQQPTKLQKTPTTLLTSDAPGLSPADINFSSPQGIAPPRAPFASDGPASRPGSRGSSRPGSRFGSPFGSRASSPKPGMLHAPSQSADDLLTHPGLPRTKTQSVETEQKLKRRSWMPGTKAQPRPTGETQSTGAKAWIAGHNEKMPYSLTPLVSAQQVAELWDETGGMFTRHPPSRILKPSTDMDTKTH